ncbi:MAG: triose-phosphate isomerase [Rickettsiales bacterium]|nr:triose-phosphate isomerase [Rickettsiales bacterium]
MLIAGNWKMHGLCTEAHREVHQLLTLLADTPLNTDVAICPPFTLLPEMADWLAASPIALGAQDCHTEVSGAFTGDISAVMLKEVGCRYVIVGHSERRAAHHESSEQVCQKAGTAQKVGLIPIVCVGETEEEHAAGSAEKIVRAQLDASLPAGSTPETLVVAYEPVWAIGSGKTPTLGEIQTMHAVIHQHPSCGKYTQVLYGGSVKPENAREILALPGVDGALVGGASLQADSFYAIITAVAA